MGIVVVRSPRCLRGLRRKLFGLKRSRGPGGTESFSEGGIFVPACTYSGPKAEWLTRRGGPGRADSICKGEDDYGA